MKHLRILSSLLIILGLVLSVQACAPSFELTHSEVEIYAGQNFNPLHYLKEEQAQSSSLEINHNVNPTTPGEYEVNYNLDGVKRTLKVIVHLDPIILLKDHVILETSSPFNPLDYLSTESKVHPIQIHSNVDTNTPQDYIVVYSFSGIDKVLNVSIQDLDISLPMDRISVDLGTPFNPVDYAEFNFPNSQQLSITNLVDTNAVGTYHVTYSNGKTNHVLQVDVKDASPFLTRTETSIRQGSAFNPREFLIEADRNNANILITNPVNPSVAGAYTVTYTLGNVTKSLAVTVTSTPTTTTNPTNNTSTRLRVESLTSPVSPNEYATLVVIGKPGKSYSIVVNYKSGPSTAAGLEPKVAGSDGRVSWTWKIGARTTAGSWTINVTGDGQSISTKITVR